MAILYSLCTGSLLDSPTCHPSLHEISPPSPSFIRQFASNGGSQRPALAISVGDAGYRIWILRRDWFVGV